MRQKDWADDEAERLFDMVRDAVDDEKIIDEIAKSLRKSGKDMIDEPITGPVGEEPHR